MLGLVIAFSIPREYTSTVRLAPEDGESNSMSGLGALAAMAGIYNNFNGSSDALYPMIYPDVVESIPFLTGLFDLQVPAEDGKTQTIVEYIEKDMRRPWWSVIIGLPRKFISLFKSKEADNGGEGHVIDNFHLTRHEDAMVGALRGCIKTVVDPKTSIVTVAVTTQDAMVSAVLANAVVKRLQESITEYRTEKARQDLEYALKLNNEARDNYYEAQQRYAEYLDRNHGIVLHSVQVTKQRLENEAQLAFNLYNQTSQQLQLAQAKVQEHTPVCAIVTPATVPLLASAPRKPLILVTTTFIAGVLACAWILFGETLKRPFRREIGD